jgi:hypothetical protein
MAELTSSGLYLFHGNGRSAKGLHLPAELCFAVESAVVCGRAVVEVPH